MKPLSFNYTAHSMSLDYSLSLIIIMLRYIYVASISRRNESRGAGIEATSQQDREPYKCWK